MHLCRKKISEVNEMTSLLHLKTANRNWPHKAKSKTGHSQNAFHRGQYANISKAANVSPGVVLQIQEA